MKTDAFLGQGERINLLNSMAPGMLITLQWMTSYPEVCEQHKLKSLLFFKKNSKDMKLEAKNSGGSESLGKSVHEYYQSPWDKILKELINIV